MVGMRARKSNANPVHSMQLLKYGDMVVLDPRLGRQHRHTMDQSQEQEHDEGRKEEIQPRGLF